MNRTSLALKRLGVPVLALTTVMTAGQLALGTTSAFAAGALTITPNPASSQPGTPVTLTITDTGDTTGETVNLTVTGSAFFTANGSNSGQSTSIPCPANGGATADVCTIQVNDNVAETVTVTATGVDSTNSNTDSVTFQNQAGSFSFSPNPAFGTASPIGGVVPSAAGDAKQTVTYVPGSQSVSPNNAQTTTLTVSGSAWFDPGGADNSHLTFPVGQTKPKSITCTIPAAPAARTCTYDVADSISEAVTVTAGQASPDLNSQSATATVNFAGLFWANCSGNQQNTAANCATQQGAGTTATYTITYQEAGQPAVNRAIQFTITGANGNVFPVSQPTNTSATNATTAQCTTNAQGQCQVSVASSGSATNSDTIVAKTQNTLPYPASEADQKITNVPNATPGRFVLTGNPTLVAPGTQVDAVNEPGDVVQNTFTLFNCQANTTTGSNTCIGQTALAGQSVTLTVDHGFFTPLCTSAVGPTTSYANCTFNTTPASGTKVGDLKNLGTSMTATTNAQGQVTVALAIARDTAFDQNGSLTATVTAVASGVTLTESAGPGNSPSGTTCNAVNNNPQPGCPTGTVWTTNAQPLNGASVKIVSIPASSSEATLTDGSTTNNVPNNQFRVVTVALTDQFGNLTSGAVPGNATGVTLVKTGVGDLLHCTGWTSTNTCTGPGTGQNNPSGGNSANTTDSSGVTTTTFKDVRGSYLSQFTSAGTSNITQDRYLSTPCAFQAAGATCVVSGTNKAQTGTQTLTATWKAPTTTFNTFTAGSANNPAVATYTASTATMTDAVTINYFAQTAQAVVTFTTTPSNTVSAGTVVTVSATVKDQFGNPIAGDFVQFIRSGPNPNNGTDCTANSNTNGNNGQGTATNAQGQAGFSFTCNTPGQQLVTIVVTDANGNELARGTQTINFTNGTPGGGGPVGINSPSNNGAAAGSTFVLTGTAPAGAVVTLTGVDFRNGTHTLGTATADSNGKWTFTTTAIFFNTTVTASAPTSGGTATSNTIIVAVSQVFTGVHFTRVGPYRRGLIEYNVTGTSTSIVGGEPIRVQNSHCRSLLCGITHMRSNGFDRLHIYLLPGTYTFTVYGTGGSDSRFGGDGHQYLNAGRMTFTVRIH
jgi:hypothetical protein